MEKHTHEKDQSRAQRRAAAKANMASGGTIMPTITGGERNVQGAVIPTLQQYADIEAQKGHEFDMWRCPHWARVIGDYKHDAPELAKYPSLVRHAKAKLMGLDMSIVRSKWSDSQRKLYDNFCNNQVSPLSMFIQLALGDSKTKGIGCDAVVAFLNKPGTLPAKVADARILLGRPKRERGTKGAGNHGEAATAAAKATEGKQQWDLSNLRTRPAEEAVALLVATFDVTKLINTVTAVVAKLKAGPDGKGNKDPIQVKFAKALQDAVRQFDVDSKEPDDTGEEGEDEGEQLPIASNQ